MIKRLLYTLTILLWSVAVQALEEGTAYNIGMGTKSVFVTDASLASGAKVRLWTDTDVPAQRWILEDRGNDRYALRNAYSGCYLGCNSVVAGAPVVQRGFNDSYVLWLVTPVEDAADTYTLTLAAAPQFCMSVADTDADGVSVNLSKVADTEASACRFVMQPSASQPRAFDATVRDRMVDAFLNQYYHKATGGHVLGTGGWWGDAEMFETILDAFATTGDLRYKTIFSELYNNFISRNGSDWTNNEYNDDITWMVLACIRAYKYFGTADYLTKARTNYDNMYRRAKQKFGTLIWKQSQENKLATNSCINCPATVAACYLAQMTGDDAYYAKALSIYAGQRKLLFNASTGEVWDCRAWNPDGTGESSYNTWVSTYNQGTMLGAAVMLYRYTKDSRYLQDADRIYARSRDHLTDGNKVISVCQTINGDLCGFKGILMRYVRMYAEELHHEDALQWMERNAWHAYQNRMSRGVIWSAWLTKTAESLTRMEGNDFKDVTQDAFGSSTAVSVAVNAHVNRQFSKPAFAPVEVRYFDDIQFMQMAETAEDGDTPHTTPAALTGGYICFRNVDFGDRSARQVMLRIKATVSRAYAKVYIDSIADSRLAGRTDGWLAKAWSDVPVVLKNPVSGVHDVYVQFSGAGVQLHNLCFSETTTGVADSGTAAGGARLSLQGNRLTVEAPVQGTLTLYSSTGSRMLRRRVEAGNTTLRLGPGVHIATLRCGRDKQTLKAMTAW